MYHTKLVQPMRDELTALGFEELRTPEEVDQALEAQQDSILLVVNSVCGCSAGACRPAVALALKHDKRPSKLTTVFAGQDKEATEKARTYFDGLPPSSPAIALLKGGQVVSILQRWDIEGRNAEQVAEDLVKAFDEHC
jgi:putative YphP/YqiW family bacilliredoxin